MRASGKRKTLLRIAGVSLFIYLIFISLPNDVATSADQIFYYFDSNNGDPNLGYAGNSPWGIPLNTLPEQNGYHLPVKEGYIAYEDEYDPFKDETEYGFGYYINSQWPDNTHWEWDGNYAGDGSGLPPGVEWHAGTGERNPNPMKVLIYSPWSHKSCVAIIGDSGPAPWSGRQFGVSNKVFEALGLPESYTRADGKVFSRGNPNPGHAPGPDINPTDYPVIKYDDNPYWVEFLWADPNRPPGNVADLNHDGLVNAIDFAILLHYWGSAFKPPADINQDGIVNSVDFGIMMSNWYNPLPITGESLTSEGINARTLNAQVQGAASTQENQATLWLSPNAGTYQIGESFDVDIFMNTGGQNAVVAAAYLKYDPTQFRANNIDTTGSVFTMEPERIIDSSSGIAGITRGVITPGVNTANGKIATINLTALSPISPKTNNVTFLFIPGSTIGSAVCRDDELGTNILSEVYNGRFAIPGTVTLQSPLDHSVFNACSLIINYQPTFSWMPNGTFKNFKILFSTSPTNFKTPIARAIISGKRNSYTPPIGLWEKIMRSSNNKGNIRDIYWKVIGTQPDRITIETEVRSFRVASPQQVAINSPPEGAILCSTVRPAFNFDSNCNTKFLLQFSSVSDFSEPKKIKGFIFTTRDPNVETTLDRILNSQQWTLVKKLVGSGTGYFRIKAWDRINRETISEVRSFTLQ